jgi:hypothetical protein
MDGATGLAVPHHGRFTLVGDADPGNVARRYLPRDHAAAGQNALPDLLRIVLNPAVVRIELLDFNSMRGQRQPRGIEQDRAGRSGALL